MSIGSRIKELREGKQISRNDFADMIGVTVGAISNYENDISSPKEPILFKIIETLECEPNYIFQDMVKIKTVNNDVTLAEYNHIKKYRFISERSPDGAKVVDSVLDGMYSIAEQMKAPESGSTIIEFHGRTDDSGRFLEYFHSASAGTGVFILGNEASEKIAIPDTPENQLADYAIGVDGNSMEPDYHDGDIVLVSQKVELKHGDVGIFVINNKAYIKEYGETELISRNPDADNIRISEYDNIVCMGKVIGKL